MLTTLFAALGRPPSLISSYWKAHISTEMHQVNKTLQSLFERTGRSFDDGPPSLKCASRRIARRDRVHPPSAKSGALSGSTRVDTPVTERGKSSLILNRHGGLQYAPQGSADHRVSQPNDVVEKEKPSPTRSTHHLYSHEMNRAIVLVSCARITSTRGTDAMP